MSTEITTLKPLGDTTGALSTEKSTYKAFVKFTDKGDVDTINVKAESANQENWKKLTAAGLTEWNTNEFIRYVVHTKAGFDLLVPSEEQQIYIIQAGLNYIQNAKANAIASEKDETNENNPAHNQETIDLREYINKPPEKRSLTDQQKLERLVKSMGLSADEMQNMFAQLAKNFASQQQAAPATEEEEVPQA